MNIEDEVYLNYSVNEEKLIHYGFRSENGELVYTRLLPQDNLKIIVEYDGTIHGRIIDLAVNEEYANFRREGTTGYSAGIRQQFIDLLLDIRDKCCRNQYFKSEQARRVKNYIYETYDGTPDFCGRIFRPMVPIGLPTVKSGMPSLEACRFANWITPQIPARRSR